MKPVILITNKPDTSDFGVGGIYKAQANYCHAILLAGGIPLIAANGDPEDYACLADGLLFTGSACDITPSHFGQENRKSLNCNVELDNTELQLFKAFYEKGKPILGICRGLQLINVAMGGTLVQDIPDQIQPLTVHQKVYDKETEFHSVTAREGSLFHRLFGSSFLTNSYHHQAAKDCAPGMIATVVTEDGVIEAIEHESKPIIATQWHPERMIGQEQTELTDMMPLFRHFISLCGK